MLNHGRQAAWPSKTHKNGYKQPRAEASRRSISPQTGILSQSKEAALRIQLNSQKEFRGRHLLGPSKEVTGEYDRS